MTCNGLIGTGFFETFSTLSLQSLVSDLCATGSPSTVNAIHSAAGTGGISVPCAGALCRVFRHAMFLCITGHVEQLCLG